VVCADRDTKRGEPLVSEWAKRFPKSDNAKPNDPPRVVFKQVDVSKMEAIKEMIDFTSATFGGFEALANNAGMFVFSTLADLLNIFLLFLIDH
jgi:NAD(P)-dependent dehydrogenase (short-subunit alcohol dehydrogenase family)